MKYVFIICLSILANFSYSQNTQIRGKIVSPVSELVSFHKYNKDIQTGELVDKIIAPVNSKGEFNITITAKDIDTWLITHGDKDALIDLKPGDHLDITFNKFDEYYEDYDVSGGMPADINFKRALDKDSIYNQKFKEELNQFSGNKNDLPAILKKRLEKSYFKLAYLDNYKIKHGLSNNYYNWLKNEFLYEPYERFCVEDLLGSKTTQGLSFFEDIKELNLNNDAAASCSATYNDFVKYYTILKTSGTLKSYRSSDLFTYGLKYYSGTTKKVLLTQQILSVKGIDSIYNRLYPQFIAEVKDNALIKLVSVKRDDYLKMKSAGASIENVNNYSQLEQIFKKYLGKVVYIDFWASWCKPCRAEMPNSTILRNRFTGKDVVFVYLGYKDDKANWLAARKKLNINGEHYFLDGAVLKEAEEVFKINGIPHYAILDKKGRIIEKKFSGPGDEMSFKTITDLLK